MNQFSHFLAFTLFLIFALSVKGQNNYDQQWKKVEQNTEKGLFKSNLPIVLDIQKQAIKEQNITEIVKSLRAELSIINRTKDDTKNNIGSQFYQKIQQINSRLRGTKKTTFEALSILFIRDYLNQNRWKINDRTSIDQQDLSEIETWSKLDFKKYLSHAFQQLANKQNQLRKVKFHDLEAIFKNTTDIAYFPTLQDWLTLQEIDFLKNDFLFTPNEIQENQAKILALYDREITSNKGNVKLYWEKRKIDYRRHKENFSDEKYREELFAIMHAKTKGDYKLLIIEAIAENLKEDHPKEALKLLEQAKNFYPKSRFHNNLINAQNSITRRVIQLNFERYTLPNQPIHLSIKAKNTDSFSVKIYRVKKLFSFVEFLDNPYKHPLSSVKKSYVRTDNFKLINLGDYQSHTSSLALKPLENGLYIIEYMVNGKTKGYEWFSATNHRIIYQSKDQPRSVLKLINRKSGAALGTIPLKIYEYNNNKGSLFIYQYTTDAKGKFSFAKKNNYYRNFLISEAEATNVLLFDTSGKNHSPTVKVSTKTKATILTDRAIYRPGQTVYFKVINVTGTPGHDKVATGLKQTLILLDSNEEEISRQTFTTNEFGSYWGSFTLPKGKLNGNFILKTEDQLGWKSFKVEEYKRPKFEVIFDDIKGEYQFGDTIHLTGKAVSYSGVPLSGTTVNYEIKKEDLRYRYFFWAPRSYNKNSILGSVKTNEKGEFSIPVILKKNDKIKGIQVEGYSVNASVTDINGETQNDSKNFRVASVSHFIQSELIPSAFTDENVELEVHTKNYNDQDLGKTYQVKLTKLEAPQRIFRDNFENEISDLKLMTKEEFIQKFPHDYYDKSESKNNWKTQKIVLQKTASGENLNLGKLPAGYYKLELYNIEGQDTIKNVQQFSVWDKNQLADHMHPFLMVKTDQSEYQPGETATVYLYSAIPNAQVYLYQQDGSGKTLFETKTIVNGLLKYKILMPTDPNNPKINLQIALPAYNDIQTKNLTLVAKKEEKPMEIQLATFRDKIHPGDKETWSLKIIGKNGEKAATEVLANMYDKSLDLLAANSFRLFNIPNRKWTPKSYLLRPEQLQSIVFRQNYDFLDEQYIAPPQFNWYQHPIEMVAMVDAKPLIRGVSRYKAYTPPPSPIATQTEINEVALVKPGTKPDPDLSKIKVRKNLKETAFFYPNLKTDKEGKLTFEFTAPEALTKWKLMFLAHDKQANWASLTQDIITQKEFSVTPNYPRFLREGDEIIFQSKLSSLVDKTLNGKVQLQILDAFTNEDISAQFNLENRVQSFALQPKSSTAVSWKIKVPKGGSGIILKVVAQAGKFSDGEQNDIPILSNRMLVTDAVPIFVKEGQTKTFVLENLKNNHSTSVENFSNTLELTTNPIWEIIFALPSLKQDHNQSADAVFNRWFADVLASEIFKANPRMKAVFEEYRAKDLLKSNLEKNQELKQLLLEETPWVLQAKSEKEQMQKIARLFDANNMRYSIQDDWEWLVQMQNSDGGFGWMQGYPSSYSVSLYILKNLGNINQLVKDNIRNYQTTSQKNMVRQLINYVDGRIDDYWNDNRKPWSNLVLDYLNTRHYWEKEFPLKGIGAQLKKEVKAKAHQAKFTDFTFYGLSRMALLMDAYGLKDISKKLITYLKETSTQSKTQGVYWKQNLNDWGWYSSKTINQALALQAFQQLIPGDEIIEEAKIWLITQKKVSHWSTSRATAEVIYTILNTGKSWTSPEADKAVILWGGKELSKADTKATGFIKESKRSSDLNKNLATVKISKPGPGIVQGGLYWQYFEDLNKIKSSETYLSLTKELYKKVKTENGEVLKKITAKTPLQVGDKVTVRMILNTDRAMQFIHIKDMRAAGFEPVDAISEYRWKNNLGFYQSTKDASTNFYISYMPKGKYVFEYDLIANAAGTFSNGITTMQNYYAPEMNARSNGTTVRIEPMQ